MRTLVVGCGSIGQRHARLLGERRDVQVGVCDPLQANVEAAAQAAGNAEKYLTLDEALKHDFAAAIVCTPNDSHAEISIRAMQAGLDVLVEKPIEQSVEAAERMRDAAEKTGRLLSVGYTLRFHPAIREMKRRGDAGALGTLVGARAMVGTYLTLMSARTPYRLTQKGVLVADYTHQIDYLGLFFGKVTDVTARGGVFGDLPMRPDPNLIAALLTYGSGAVASLHLDYIQHPQRHMLELYGDKGSLVFNFESNILEEYRAAAPGARVESIPYFRDNMFREEHAAFFESVRTRVPAVSAEEGIEALRVGEAILKAMGQRAPVRL